MESTQAKRGARSYLTIDRAALAEIELGRRQTRTHVEQMAVDMDRLLAVAFPGLKAPVPLSQMSFIARMRAAGQLLAESYQKDAAPVAADFDSDIVRGWGAFAIGCIPDLSLSERLALIRDYADDDHFAVREWAWLAVRPHVAADPVAAIGMLESWVVEPSYRIRRFAVESTRPRGVWSAHIPLLKSAPWLAEDLLRPLADERHRYVCDSFANWLNDAAKSQPEWVARACDRWLCSSDRLTSYTRKRALRSLTA